MRHPNRTERSRSRGRQRGFSIVAAIFLLVVLAALGAAIAIVNTAQQVGSAMDVEGARVYQAARAGIEWGAYKELRMASCVASTSFTFPTAPTLAGVAVTVTCKPFTDAKGGPTVYEIQSTACNQPSAGNCPNPVPGANYVERRLRVTL